ncbi:MAG: energy-coupling factor transporter transmembrane component T family protein [Candidatus Kariarchaeaceae archaeon]|jgi:energy-coupling factor transporter transmembrane protein EcfT
MLISELLNFDGEAQFSWTGKRDPRVKLLFALVLTISVFIARDSELLFFAAFALIVAGLTISFRGLVQLLWGLRWFVFAIVLINLYLADWQLTPNVGFLLLKLLTIILSFVVFNRTTSADQVVDTLMKLKVPSTLAWTIGASIRQTIFVIDEISFLREIQRTRSGYHLLPQGKKIRYQVKEVYSMLISLFARAFIVSGPFADTLNSRGWKEAHPTITLHTTKIDRGDILFILLTILFPILLRLLFSSQIYIK